MALRRERLRFTTEQYHRMVDAGVLSPDDRVELLRGEIVEMAAIGARHAGTVKWLNMAFTAGVRGRAVVAVQDPVTLEPDSEPEPDVALLRPRPDHYRRVHRRPDDVLLVIEVAETSAPDDRSLKIPLYARAGIEEAWLVGLEAERVEVYRGPGPDSYADRVEVGRGGTLAPAAFPDIESSVDELLG